MDNNDVYQVDIIGKIYSIPYFKKDNMKCVDTPVNIYASGPSIDQLSFNDDLLNNPALFVNGSISLTAQHAFKDVIAYIITDARFIEHQHLLLAECYKGQPLFITANVLDLIVKKLPEFFIKYHQCLTLIYPADKLHKMGSNSKKSFSLSIFKPKKASLTNLVSNPNFVIDANNLPKPVGVSLDITHGFVEAGTVAYVAAQLAYTLGANQIHLYGIDLLNSSQPRFYESKDSTAPCKLDKAIENRIVPSFDLLAREYFKRGVRVINHSPVSKDLFKDIIFNY